jgi:metal iron transporter
MPHSLFLGSGLVQARLKEFDRKKGSLGDTNDNNNNDDEDEEEEEYRPSISAIRGCLKYSIVEVAVSLLTFATFVNSAILIVAGASLYQNPEAGHADLYGIYDLLSTTISPVAGTVFALALLFSGLSAGVIGTISGQMVSEGMLNWTVSPWLRRLITRSISIVPSVMIAAAVGREGLDTALTATQVVLSILLPFVTAPLIYFTSRSKYMTVRDEGSEIRMENHWWVSVLSFLVWLLVAALNVAALVFIGLGIE